MFMRVRMVGGKGRCSERSGREGLVRGVGMVGGGYAGGGCEVSLRGEGCGVFAFWYLVCRQRWLS